jgi:hypothetical protein
MRRKLKNLKNKSGHSENGAPRQLIDEALYRERRAAVGTYLGLTINAQRYDPKYSGWSNPSRPRDFAISLRSINPVPET